MLAKIVELISTAKTYCGDVEFAALDATRAGVDFLIEACKQAFRPRFFRFRRRKCGASCSISFRTENKGRFCYIRKG